MLRPDLGGIGRSQSARYPHFPDVPARFLQIRKDGSLTTAGYWRRGLTDATTGELRFEADDTVHSFGATVDHRLGLLGVGTLGAAVSDGRAGAGHMWLAGYEYTGRTFNFGPRTNVGSPGFRLVGQPETNNVQRQSYVSTGINLGPAGSIGVAWAEQRRRNLPAFTTAAVSYSTMLPGRAYLSASVSRSAGVIATTTAFLSLSIPLHARTSVGAEASTTRAAGRDSSYKGDLFNLDAAELCWFLNNFFYFFSDRIHIFIGDDSIWHETNECDDFPH